MTFQVERIFKGPGFAETLYLGVYDGRRVIRKVSNPNALTFSRIALAREIRLLSGLPEALKPYFCEILRTNLDVSAPEPAVADGNGTLETVLPQPLFYDMPYYAPEDGWRSLSSAFLDGSLDKREAWRIIDEIADIVLLYLDCDCREPAADYAERTMLASIRESLAWAASEENFAGILILPSLTINGRSVMGCPLLAEWFEDSDKTRRLLTPRFDRFLHGDFFPENVLYNHKTGKWLLIDPVSVRGIHRGDCILDLNKMDDWLSGELPALRLGMFELVITGSNVRFELQRKSGSLANPAKLGVSERYRERLADERYAGLFAEEPGWEARWKFVKAFYAFCMLPLAGSRQALARLCVALLAMADFLDTAENM